MYLSRIAVANFRNFSCLDVRLAGRVVILGENRENLLWPLIATRSMAMRTVEVGIASFHGVFVTNWPYQMAAAVTAVVPIVLLFVVTQRYFVQGIQMTGFK